MSSTAYLCKRLREAGVPTMAERLSQGATWSFWDPRRRNKVVFFLNHTDRVPMRLWSRMTAKEQSQFPPHQWPEDPPTQGTASALSTP